MTPTTRALTAFTLSSPSRASYHPSGANQRVQVLLHGRRRAYAGGTRELPQVSPGDRRPGEPDCPATALWKRIEISAGASAATGRPASAMDRTKPTRMNAEVERSVVAAADLELGAGARRESVQPVLIARGPRRPRLRTFVFLDLERGPARLADRRRTDVVSLSPELQGRRRGGPAAGPEPPAPTPRVDSDAQTALGLGGAGRRSRDRQRAVDAGSPRRPRFGRAYGTRLIPPGSNKGASQGLFVELL